VRETVTVTRTTLGAPETRGGGGGGGGGEGGGRGGGGVVQQQVTTRRVVEVQQDAPAGRSGGRGAQPAARRGEQRLFCDRFRGVRTAGVASMSPKLGRAFSTHLDLPCTNLAARTH
jgi:hypothetical protein